MLTFDPAVRITVEAALIHPYLAWPKRRLGTDKSRALETPAPHRVYMADIENIRTKSSMQDLIVQEVAWFQKHKTP